MQAAAAAAAVRVAAGVAASGLGRGGCRCAMRHAIGLPIAVDGARQGEHRRRRALARHGLLAAGGQPAARLGCVV